MRYRCLLVWCMAMACLLAGTAWSTDLDDYVNAADPAYTWSLANTIPGAGYTDYVIYSESQDWLTAGEVDRTRWWHWMVVTVPDTVTNTTGLVALRHADNNQSMPGGNDGTLINIAVDTQSVVAYLGQVINGPLTFTGHVPIWSDTQIAYTWDKFLRGERSEWLSRFPMAKSTVRAMDTVTAFCASLPGGLVVDEFVVTGTSKLGWTTWATGAVDSRVVAIAPKVIDLLNLGPSFEHHYSALGYWAAAIHDYEDIGIPQWFGTRPFQDLLDQVDPYTYRARYTMPKYLINSSGDQFFLPDSSQFYWDDLPDSKWLRYVPNTGHGLNSSAWDGFEAWYDAILTGATIPTFDWTKISADWIHVETVTGTPTQVLLWQATNPTNRDFNIDNIGAVYTSSVLAPTVPGQYDALVSAPPSGWTAFFVELTYNSGGPNPYVFTTEVSVTPDVYPATWDPDTDGDGLANSVDPDDDN
ncbi:MAG: PhoPQ-activated pathogenicity, partial [bacterium]|nr:PhoPQ-activated pathogenicity [bacterium]